MAKTAEITLGDFTFTAHPLNLGEYEDIIDDVANLSSTSAKDRMRGAKAIVMAAWRRVDPQKTDADFRAILATPTDLMTAAMKILDLSELVKATQSGEAEAGATPAAL